MIIKTSGDLGDIVAMLMFVKPLGLTGVEIDGSGGETYERNGILNFKCKFNESSKAFIQPLVEKFIPVVQSGASINHNEFPASYLKFKNLTEFHSKKYNLNWEDIRMGWLATPTEKTKKIIVSRSLRYRSNTASKYYAEILDKYDGDKVFVGLEEEYLDFQKINNEIQFCKTDKVLDLYDIINSGTDFIGNGSLGCCIAAACGLNINYEFCKDAANYLFNDERFKIFV